MSGWACKSTSSSGIRQPRACKTIVDLRLSIVYLTLLTPALCLNRQPTIDVRQLRVEAARPTATYIQESRERFMSRDRAVVLLSGGMDSCVCAALAARDYEAAALHVDYGQRTEARERQAFVGICDRLGIRHRLVIQNPVFRAIGGSALTDDTIAVPDAPSEFHGSAP